MAHHSARSTPALPVCGGIARPTAVQSGFTLVELVLVIVIVGILAATAAPPALPASTGRRGSR